MFAKASWLCLLVAVGLLVWAGLRIFADENGGGLVVEELERDLGEQTLGIHTLEMRVRNTAGQPRRIVGLASG